MKEKTVQNSKVANYLQTELWKTESNGHTVLGSRFFKKYIKEQRITTQKGNNKEQRERK